MDIIGVGERVDAVGVDVRSMVGQVAMSVGHLMKL